MAPEFSPEFPPQWLDIAIVTIDEEGELEIVTTGAEGELEIVRGVMELEIAGELLDSVIGTAPAIVTFC